MRKGDGLHFCGFIERGLILLSVMLLSENYSHVMKYFGIVPLPSELKILNIILMIIAPLAGVAAVITVTRALTVDFGMSPQVLPIAASGSFVLLLTFILTAQLEVKFTSPVISIVYVTTALLWIVLGFIRRYSSLRKSGLVLSFVALAKLFIVDLHGLPLGWRIVSFFAFGGILIAISFIYQYFNKRLEKAELQSVTAEQTASEE